MDLDNYTDNLYEKIVNKIKDTRKLQDLTQKQVADALGFNVVTYSDMESGKTKFTVTRLLAVLKFLKIEDIFTPDDSAESKELASILAVNNFDEFLIKFHQQSYEIQEMKELLKQILQKLETKP